MKQMICAAADASTGFERHRKLTRRDAILAEMQALVPWAQLPTLIKPHYPKASNGRPPIRLERMLRIHLLQHCFNLADATTILKFRHLLEKHQLGQSIFAEVGHILQQRGLCLSSGTLASTTKKVWCTVPYSPQPIVHDKHPLPDLLRGDEK